MFTSHLSGLRCGRWKPSSFTDVIEFAALGLKNFHFSPTPHLRGAKRIKTLPILVPSRLM